MKKILALILLLSGLLMAQNTDKPKAYEYSVQGILAKVTQNTIEALRTVPVKHDTVYSKTLSGANDTVKFNFNRNYIYGFTTAVDTNDANTDTLQVFYKSSLTGKLTSQMIALRDMSSYDLITDNTTLVPGQGIEKQYMIVRPYPGEVWVTWKTKSGKTTRRCLISFLGIGY